jgi:hypothetical protein
MSPPSFSVFLHRVISYAEIWSFQSMKDYKYIGTVSTLWSSFFLSFMRLANCILYLGYPKFKIQHSLCNKNPRDSNGVKPRDLPEFLCDVIEKIFPKC